MAKVLLRKYYYLLQRIAQRANRIFWIIHLILLTVRYHLFATHLLAQYSLSALIIKRTSYTVSSSSVLSIMQLMADSKRTQSYFQTEDQHRHGCIAVKLHVPSNEFVYAQCAFEVFLVHSFCCVATCLLHPQLQRRNIRFALLRQCKR